jgi:hypothetical protein
MPILRVVQRIIKEGTLQNSLYDANITLIPKPHKDTPPPTTSTKRKLWINILDEHRCKNSQKKAGKSNLTVHQKIIHCVQFEFIIGIIKMVQHTQINRCSI